ncbi:MAG: hypothetical protein CM15mV91_190 [uncultured marine virus]|nr:MAG: hypothetical protein CM15mV91_190 [uncultured marine virus]
MGRWKTSGTPYTAEELGVVEKKEKSGKMVLFNRAIEELRTKRNTLLTETDWWGASDNTMTDIQKKYRQDLRDLTAGLDTVDKVNAVVWPTKP